MYIPKSDHFARTPASFSSAHVCTDILRSAGLAFASRKMISNGYRKSLPGFTLIEMSFVLIIAGLIMGLSLPLLTTLLQQQKQRQTQTHQEQVLYAIAAFLNQHEYLPAPASPEATAAEQGMATSKTCQAAGDHCQGLIPYRTLGLMENLAKDGYHHWMTYVTSKQLTQTNRIQDVGAALHERNNAMSDKKAFCDVISGPSSLKLLDAQGLPLLGLEETKDLWALILISHGPQGSRDRENTDNGPVITIAGKSSLIKAVTRNNILAMYAHHPCQPQPLTQPQRQAPPSLEPSPVATHTPATLPSPPPPVRHITQPSPDPDDWQRPQPRHPLRERMPDDQE
jgi:prepilin-type N-terminal cleavage/methylation domain-containing protein